MDPRFFPSLVWAPSLRGVVGGILGKYPLDNNAIFYKKSAARVVELAPAFGKGYFRMAKAQLEQVGL